MNYVPNGIILRADGGVDGRSLRRSARRQDIVSLRQGGKTCGDIGRLLGISRERVCQVLRPLGMSKRLQNSIHASQDVIVQMLAEGKEYKEIAAAIGCSRSRVQAFVSLNGLAPDRELISEARLNKRYAGRKRNGLTFVRRAEDYTHKNQYCWFKCECGRMHKANKQNVFYGNAKSCGCRLEEYWMSIALDRRWDKDHGVMTRKAGHQLYEK